MIRPLILLTVALNLIMSANDVFCQSVTPPPTPPSYSLAVVAPGTGFRGFRMNALGEIAGSIPANNPNSPGATHAAIYVDGSIIDLGAKLNPDIESSALAINLQGD